MDKAEAKGSKPRWWRFLWIAVLLTTIASAVVGCFLFQIPLERVVGGVTLTFLCISVAYCIRMKPSRRLNRGLYILLGITPIGFVLWTAYALTIGLYLTKHLGSWPSLIIGFTVPYIIGAFIGDWIGGRRNYRLPLRIESS
jgi:ABC-type multidrug transport system permease subunit